MKPERVVLVLSGGGMKAMAHVGVMRALREMGKEPAEIVATSAGAFVGAMFAGGMPYEGVAQAVCSLRRDDLFQLSRAMLLVKGMAAPSVLKAKPFREFLARTLPCHDFAGLELPLRLIATDLDTGEPVTFGAAGRTDCSVPEAVYASMALPLYLPPAIIGGHRMADGGLCGVLPLDQAAGVPADLVIAVDVGPIPLAPSGWPLGPPLLAAHDRAMAILMADVKVRMVASWHADARRAPLVLIEPAVDPYGTFAFDRTVDFIEAGYRAAHAAMAGTLRHT